MEIEFDIKPVEPELKCPKCGEDMKEYVTRLTCRNKECGFTYTKQFQFRG
jgi:ribosomal protein S27AE